MLVYLQTNKHIMSAHQKQVESFGSDSSVAFYAYCDSLENAYNALFCDPDSDSNSDSNSDYATTTATTTAVKIGRAMSALRTDIGVIVSMLKDVPADMDVLVYPDVSKHPMLVLGTGNACVDLRYASFPTKANIEAILDDEHEPELALERFVTKELDMCAEENIHMTKEALMSLRPVWAHMFKKLAYPHTNMTEIYQSGFNCCGISVAVIKDGKLVVS
jgi:hypothetical protein